jgi:hypothetical protein
MSETNGTLSWAALGFALATGYNSVVAIRENLPGEPLGIHLQISVPSGIAVGWGSAVSAPWPMPLAGLLATRRFAQTGGGPGPGLVGAGVGLGGIVGILLEPNTYRPKSWAPATCRAVLLHVGASAALAATGMWHMSRARRRGLDARAKTPERRRPSRL